MSNTAELDAARVRAAKNQSLMREVNERIEQLAQGKPSILEELQRSRPIDLACECMHDTCTERITMTIAEYEQIRADSNAFLVRPGHHVREVEEIVREEADYAVVGKLGAGAAVADRLDPRKRNRITLTSGGSTRDESRLTDGAMRPLQSLHVEASTRKRPRRPRFPGR